MEENVRALIEEHKKWMQEQVDAQNRRFKEQQQQMAQQQQQMVEQHQLLMGQIMEQFQNVENVEDRNSNCMSSSEQGVRNSIWFNPKIEFPYFDGSDPKGWVKKCIRYFTLCKIMEEQKVDLAALHLRGQAEVWFNSYILGRRNIAWEDFIFDLCARFRDCLLYTSPSPRD